jgi:small conductance mechanosensitive channel
MEEQIATIQKLIDMLVEFSVPYSFQVFGVLVVLAVWFFMARSIILFNFSQKKNLDITLSKFLSNAVIFSIVGFAVIISSKKEINA